MLIDKVELRGWFNFIFRLIAHFIALAAWLFLTWALNEYVVKRFPLEEGMALMSIRVAEVVVDIAVLWQLIKLLFTTPDKKLHERWWL